jgi:hypothetical protein
MLRIATQIIVRSRRGRLHARTCAELDTAAQPAWIQSIRRKHLSGPGTNSFLARRKRGHSMTTLTVDSLVAAPVARVFEAFTDLEHPVERMSNIQRIDVPGSLDQQSA